MIVLKHQYFSKRDRQSRGKGKPPKLVAVERALAHVKYIQHRPGEDRPEGGRELFNDLEDGLDSQDVRQAVREQEDNKVVAHKLTLAPEINPEDKKAFTREIMHKLASEKGLDLEWFGTVHNNTDHHHIHVVVMGKDRNGKDVRITRDDYDRIKDWGDRYLERWHPYELEKSRQEREGRERERIALRDKEREAARAERIREGIELPWLRKKIVRETLEPYEQWKREQEEKATAAAGGKDQERGDEPEKPYFQDTIEAAGKEWSKENTLQELRDLNEYLWDHKDERIPIKDYRKLVGWIRGKERLRDEDQQPKEQPEPKAPVPEKDENSITWKGEKYGKDDSFERLTGFARDLRDDKKNRLPIEEHQQLRSWIENKDRERFSGVLEEQLDKAKTDHDRGVKNRGPERHIDPVQQEVMANPVVGIFLSGASIANTVVSWIDLRDNRDRLKEAGDGLEAAKLDKQEKYLKHKKPEEREQDEAAIEKIDKGLEENKKARDERAKDKKRKDDERDRDNPFKRDPWGRY